MIRKESDDRRGRDPGVPVPSSEGSDPKLPKQLHGRSTPRTIAVERTTANATKEDSAADAALGGTSLRGARRPVPHSQSESARRAAGFGKLIPAHVPRLERLIAKTDGT